ncbi:hypothetical protein NBRC106471_2722 [Acetobacter pasteurianus subsp. pasteurianus LMG 1262 = NBRC 106471]|nr:hypothetical protein NBRC106471_2722 [Acetobacter pasteurianus subsp. pasteurianus LMG 1262 = NBRC 106471]
MRPQEINSLWGGAALGASTLRSTHRHLVMIGQCRSPLRDDRGEFRAKGRIELIGVIAGLTN